MPLPVIIGALAFVLLSVAGISFFGWKVYAKVAAGPVSGTVGVEGPGAGPAAADQAVPVQAWIPLGLAALAGLLIWRSS